MVHAKDCVNLVLKLALAVGIRRKVAESREHGLHACVCGTDDDETRVRHRFVVGQARRPGCLVELDIVSCQSSRIRGATYERAHDVDARCLRRLLPDLLDFRLHKLWGLAMS